MSTHANVILDFGQTRVFLYTHRFGFPAESGAAIVEALRQRCGPDAFLRMVLKEHDSTIPSYQPEFMLTLGIHRDVRWIYRVVFETSAVDRFVISLPQRSPAQATADPLGVSTVTSDLRDLNAFIEIVNADRRAINEELKSSRGERVAPGTPLTPLFEMLPFE